MKALVDFIQGFWYMLLGLFLFFIYGLVLLRGLLISIVSFTILYYRFYNKGFHSFFNDEWAFWALLLLFFIFGIHYQINVIRYEIVVVLKNGKKRISLKDFENEKE